MGTNILVLDPPVKEEKPEKTGKKEVQNYTALCTNCDERFECTIRNNTSAIWHCEEYK